MGLNDIKDTDVKESIEEKSLGLTGSSHDTDKMIDEYFARERRGSTKKILLRKKNVEIPSVEEAIDIEDKSMLKVKTFGFKNGELQHNMPCAICLEELAQYSDGGYFAPCKKCSAQYIMKKKWFT